MTYTTQQLQAMSNHEINCALAVKLNVDHYTATGLLFTAKKHDGDNVISISGATDYCNNPSDIMPLAFERRIQIIPFEDNEKTEWIADQVFNDSSESAYSDTNPLRAIACLLLMMED